MQATDIELAIARAADGAPAAALRVELPDRRADLAEGLRERPQLLYLIGHGRQTPQGTVLYLVGDDGTAAPILGADLEAAIRDLAAAHRPLLAVLVTCEGGSQEDAPLASVGPLLARAGIPAVIAMQARISMGAAATLTTRLLRELARAGLGEIPATIIDGREGRPPATLAALAAAPRRPGELDAAIARLAQMPAGDDLPVPAPGQAAPCSYLHQLTPTRSSPAATPSCAT